MEKVFKWLCTIGGDTPEDLILGLQAALDELAQKVTSGEKIGLLAEIQMRYAFQITDKDKGHVKKND